MERLTVHLKSYRKRRDGYKKLISRFEKTNYTILEKVQNLIDIVQIEYLDHVIIRKKPIFFARLLAKMIAEVLLVIICCQTIFVLGRMYARLRWLYHFVKSSKAKRKAKRMKIDDKVTEYQA